MQFSNVDDIQLEHEEEYEKAVTILQEVHHKFVKANGRLPTEFYISDDEELQSIMMLVCVENGNGYNRTSKATYCE